MIYEVAMIEVRAGAEAAFEEVVGGSRATALAAHGCLSIELYRTLEAPQRYMLRVGWEALEDHVVRFRGSEAFVRWRDTIAPFLAKPPEVTHAEQVIF